MSKKIIGLLLAICLVVGLLPMMASAAEPADATLRFGFNNIKLTDYDTPVYTMNYSKTAKDTAGNEFTMWGQTATGANESNYNAKYEWKTGEAGPTLTLRGFKFVERNVESGLLIGKVVEGEYTSTSVQAYPITLPAAVPMNIVLTGEDSLIAGAFGITFKNDTTITSEGATKLVMNNASSCITSNETEGADLTINANLDLRKSGYYNSAYGGAIIRTYKADLTINGGTIVATTTATKSVAGLQAAGGGNVIINGGNITAHGVAGQSPTNGSIMASVGSVIINGGTVTATALEAVPIYAKQDVEINGGTVNINSPYYGMNASDGAIKINGGTVEIVSVNGGFYKAPVLGAGVDGFAGASENEADYYDETKYKAKYVKLGTDLVTPTQPSTTPSAPATTPSAPATTPSASSTTPSAPATTPSQTAPSIPAEPGAALATQPSVKFGFSTLKLTHYDKPVYTMNYSKETQDTAGNKFTMWGQTSTGANEDNYNAKFVWNTGDATPTLILRGFKMDEWNNDAGKMESTWDSNAEAYTGTGKQTYAITTDKKIPLTILLTGEDSMLETKFGITFYNNLTIKSEGATKMVMNNATSGIVSNNTEGATLTIDANLNLTVGEYYNTAFNGAVIRTYKADLTINGGTITVKMNATKSVAGISAGSGGNVIINGGKISATGAAGTSATNGSINANAGKIIINGGEVSATSKYAVPLYALNGIEVNGGKVDIVSPYYGINVGTSAAPAEFKFNGGTVTIMAERACYSGAAPVLGKDVFAYVGAGPKSAEIYDGTDTKLAQKPWMKLTNDPNEKIELEDEEEDVTLPTFTLPTTGTQAPTTPDATDPSAAPTTGTEAPTTGTEAPSASQAPDASEAPEASEAPDATEAPEESGTKVELSGGISAEIPQALIDAGFDTVEKIQEALINSIWTIDENADNVAFFDAVLMFKDGEAWIKADETHFPEDGVLKVVLPYPEGTDKNTQFTALHMFTSAAFGKTPGEIELLTPVCTDDGIEVEVTGLSPIALAWTTDADADQGEIPDVENPETGDTGVAMIIALLVVAAFGMAAVVVIGKKRIA